MRKALLLLAVFGLIGSVWAADPMVGTWKLNVAKSKFSPAYLAFQKIVAPKEQSNVVREVGDQLEVTVTGIRTDGSPISDKGAFPRQGGMLQAQSPSLPKGTSIVVTVIGPGHWYFTVLQNDKQVEVVHHVMSKDGKTVTDTITGTDAQGKPFETVEFFEKQ